MQKDEHSACCDGQDNKVDPPCNSTSVLLYSYYLDYLGQSEIRMMRFYAGQPRTNYRISGCLTELDGAVQGVKEA